MAHYALLSDTNVVVQVITGIDEDELIEGKDPETWYGEFHNAVCKRTSFNTNGNKHLLGGTPFRGNYAGVGYLYDPVEDVFIPPSPFPSWILSTESWTWEAPVPAPTSGVYYWNEDTLEWVIPSDDE